MKGPAYDFPRWPAWELFRTHFRRYGLKAIYKSFRYTIRRPFSRALIARHAPRGRGVEVGVGSQSIAPLGRTYLSDAHAGHAGQTSLARLRADAWKLPFESGSLAFVLSEHVLEHIANPLRALREWHRVLEPGGALLLFLPHPARCFDRNRERTTLAHVIEDERAGVDDADPTHLPEWLERVVGPGLAPQYADLAPEAMLSTGSIHYHVWGPEQMVELLEHAGFEIRETHETVPDRNDSFAVVARRKVS